MVDLYCRNGHARIAHDLNIAFLYCTGQVELMDPRNRIERWSTGLLLAKPKVELVRAHVVRNHAFEARWPPYVDRPTTTTEPGIRQEVPKIRVVIEVLMCDEHMVDVASGDARPEQLARRTFTGINHVMNSVDHNEIARAHPSLVLIDDGAATGAEQNESGSGLDVRRSLTHGDPT